MNSYIPWLYPALVTHLQFIALGGAFVALALLRLVLFRKEVKKRQERRAEFRQAMKKMRDGL